MKWWLACAALVALGGCSGQLAELKSMPLSGDDFSSALAREYRDYADSEAEQGRASQANRFAAKGLSAARNQPSLPDEPEAHQVKLAGARAELMALLTPENKDYNPSELARAQVLYDCWVSEDARGFQAESDACASEFRAVVDRLREEL